MTGRGCQRYLEEPESFPDHLAECPGCAKLQAGFEGEGGKHVDLTARLATSSLPLAPWEGARHRAWPFVAAAAVAIALLAFLFFQSGGVAPLEGFVRSVRQSALPSLRFDLFVHLGNSLHQAPWTVHLGVALSFVIVNVVLALLLRRAPKGFNATSD